MQINIVIVNKCCSGGRDQAELLIQELKQRGHEVSSRIVHARSSPEQATELKVDMASLRMHGARIVIPSLGVNFASGALVTRLKELADFIQAKAKEAEKT